MTLRTFQSIYYEKELIIDAISALDTHPRLETEDGQQNTVVRMRRLADCIRRLKLQHHRHAIQPHHLAAVLHMLCAALARSRMQLQVDNSYVRLSRQSVRQRSIRLARRLEHVRRSVQPPADHCHRFDCLRPDIYSNVLHSGEMLDKERQSVCRRYRHS